MPFEPIIYSVSTLFSLSIRSLMKEEVLCHFMDDLYRMPSNIKEKVLVLMCRNGLVTDSNIDKVVHVRTKTLTLTDCDVSDRALQKLTCCKNLKKLDLNTTKGVRESITYAGLQIVARSCPYLQYIALRRCVNVTDTAIIDLAQSCRHLIEMNLAGCPQITDASLVAVSQSCPQLQSFNFSNTKVTDQGVITLAMGVCKASLTEVHMNHCIHVTNEAVEGFVQFCPNINILIFHGCPCITGLSI